MHCSSSNKMTFLFYFFHSNGVWTSTHRHIKFDARLPKIISSIVQELSRGPNLCPHVSRQLCKWASNAEPESKILLASSSHDWAGLCVQQLRSGFNTGVAVCKFIPGTSHRTVWKNKLCSINMNLESKVNSQYAVNELDNNFRMDLWLRLRLKYFFHVFIVYSDLKPHGLSWAMNQGLNTANLTTTQMFELIYLQVCHFGPRWLDKSLVFNRKNKQSKAADMIKRAQKESFLCWELRSIESNKA